MQEVLRGVRMEIINRSKFDIALSDWNEVTTLSDGCIEEYRRPSFPINIYLKLAENLILIKKVTEFCNKIIIKDSLIENEVEVEVMK